MSVRVASGRVGSSGIARVSLMKGLTHQRCENSRSTAKTGSLLRIASATAPSRKLHMVERDNRVAACLVEVFQAPHLESVERTQQDRKEILKGAGRHRVADP